MLCEWLNIAKPLSSDFAAVKVQLSALVTTDTAVIFNVT
jgi:hypothetical protein